MIKKIIIGMAVLFATYSVNSLAYSPRETVTKDKFTFGLAGLYFKPSTQFFDNALLYPDGYRSFNTHLDRDSNLGFKATVNYKSPLSNQDFAVAYTIYQQKNTSLLSEPFNHINLNHMAEDNLTYQALDLDVKNLYLTCGSMQVSFFTGLRFANIDDHLTANFIDNRNSQKLAVDQKSTFSGIGPRITFDTRYQFGSGISGIAQISAAGLLGNSKYHYLVNDGANVAAAPYLEANVDDNSHIIPNISAKVGLAYHYRLCNASSTRWTAEVGYQVDHYYNPLHGLKAPIVKDGYYSFERADVSFEGPYVGIQLHV